MHFYECLRAMRRGVLWCSCFVVLMASACGTLRTQGAVGKRVPPPVKQVVMVGTVVGIRSGRLELRNVQFRPETMTPKTRPVIVVGKGAWVTSTHWQGIGGHLDVFIGEHIRYYLRNPSNTLVPELQWLHGVVVSDRGARLSLVEYDGVGGEVDTWKCRMGTAVLRVPPYAKLDARTVRAGEEILVGWFGPKRAPLVWQIAVLGTVTPQASVSLGSKSCRAK